ncbi:hypothetical protein VMCG_10098 [Cytospora schulzeri]|uniref:Uncharacterized protein n=1 Tax=Cytospora schulzeri TaxID=448051 RepID=A0A423VGE9_9PEZI|nr:hypothetical protein VMCG_10098 [Valsa malicola]
MTTMRSPPGHMGSAHVRHPSLPASPTLTNPDMILPDYEYDRSPSPVRLDSNRCQSPLTMWKNAQATGSSGNMDNILYTQPDQHFRDLSSVPTTTPIIYGNGTMLSDIGEVTEVESTPSRPSPPASRQSAIRLSPYATKVTDSETDVALQSSPTMGKRSSLSAIKKKAREQAAQRERPSSAGSDSTITDHHDQPKLFTDVNDAASVAGDSVFLGDDEESLASSYVDDSDVNGPSNLGDTLTSGHPHANGQKYSTAQLSRRAEHILANAKRRLTTMEDNLSRARNTLTVASYSSGSNASTPSPPIARATSALFLSTSNSSSPSMAGHSRMGSDNSLRIGLPIKVYPQRSSSVFGVPSSRQQPLVGSRSADQLNGQYTRASYIVREAQVALDPLSEDDASQASNGDQLATNYRHSTMTATSPIYESDPERGLTRSASATHMRDIKDQVKDLKGKISSLREQARVDSLKRMSMQSSRTPSPFTHAQVDHWYTGSGSGIQASRHEEGPARASDRTTSFGKDSADEDAMEVYGHGNVRHATYVDHGDYESRDALRESGFVDVEDEDDDRFTENGDGEDEDNASVSDAYETMSESGESLYHEAVQEQLSHEDREDAFDYEHFFLHSAMGTISQRMGRRDSVATYSSDTSIETTRGPLAEVDTRRPQLSRRSSDTSISTVGTFATADESLTGRRSAESSRSKKSETDGYSPEPYAGPNDTFSETQGTPQAARQVTFTGVGTAPYGTPDRPSPEGQRRQDAMYSATRPPLSTTVTTRARRGPSVSSIESTGTTRSFPLVNRTSRGSSAGILTPDGGSPSQAVRSIPNSPLRDSTVAYRDELQDGATARSKDAASRAHQHSISIHSLSSTASLIKETGTTAVMETLPRDDQFLVERLVASLGRCVLGLTESGRGSAEGRMYRRRIDAARRILEGIERV